ncbi:MAG TPA: ComF family protein [Rhizomicrobium sp.]|nr:ComF family protein [Rhizomicrobium sp.]
MSEGPQTGTVHALHEIARRLGRSTLDLLFPPLCASCRAPVGEPYSLCAACWRAVQFLDGPCCAQCGYPFDFDPGADTRCGGCLARPPAFDTARAIMRYDDKSRDLVLAFKRADRLDLAPAFANWLARVGKPLLDECDVIVPVPLHPARLWQRRYNQSALLAQALARRVGRPAQLFALERVRRTPSQGQMVSAKARRRNVLGAFRVVNKELLSGRKVLLVDDVYTTGATLEACARALKRVKVQRIFVLTLARVVRPASSAI